MSKVLFDFDRATRNVDNRVALDIDGGPLVYGFVTDNFAYMVPNHPPSADVQANADLLRRVAAAIGLTGATLVEVCDRVILDLGAEGRSVDGAERPDAASGTMRDP